MAYTYIRISEQGIVLEISPVSGDKNIFDYYVEGIASQFIKVDAPDNLHPGWTYLNGEFAPPAEQDQSTVPVEPLSEQSISA